MTTRQETGRTLPNGIVLALVGVAAACAVGFAAIRGYDGNSSGSTESNTAALPPSIPVEMTAAERHIADMQFHEDLTTNVFGPQDIPVSPVPQKTVEEQIADAIAEHENGLAAQGW